MRRKNLLTALACTCCLAIGAAPAVVMAEESTEATTEAETAEEAEDAEGETEAEEADAAEGETEAEEETEVETEAETEAERPDYTALDYVELGEYKGLTIQIESTEVTDEEVEEQAKYYISTSGVDGALETLTDGTVQDGDIAVIDYEGKLDGVAFDGGTSEGYELEIGSGTFIDGFEEGLIGVNVGETVDLTLTFPETYSATELAGQEVVFTVTVNEIQRAAELTDDLVNTATSGTYTDVESYLSMIRSYLEYSAESDRINAIDTEILTQLYNNSVINGYPEDVLDYIIDQAIDYYTEMAAYYYLEYEDLIGLYGYTEESFLEQLTLMAQSSLQQELLLKAVAETEGIELTDEEYEEGIESYASYYGYSSTDALVEAIGGEKDARLSLLMDKIFVFLEDSSVIEEIAAEEAETETTEAE